MGDMPENWNQRYRANLELIKTGDVRELAVVVRNLFLLDMEKGLSAGEKKMLNVAKQMMISEIMILENREALPSLSMAYQIASLTFLSDTAEFLLAVETAKNFVAIGFD